MSETEAIILCVPWGRQFIRSERRKCSCGRAVALSYRTKDACAQQGFRVVPMCQFCATIAHADKPLWHVPGAALPGQESVSKALHGVQFGKVAPFLGPGGPGAAN